MIETLEHLAAVLKTMQPGQRLDIEEFGLRHFWPRPEPFEVRKSFQRGPFPGIPVRVVQEIIDKADDYLSEQERADQWCAQFGCTVREPLFKRGLQFERVK